MGLLTERDEEREQEEFLAFLKQTARFKRKHNPSYVSRNWVIDLRIVYEYEILQTIDIHEFVLLARIDGLVKHGRGCYASNQWLAKRHGCKVRRLQQLLSSLQKKGFIEIKLSKNRTKRLIWTKWSPREPLRKKNSKKVRK